MSTGMRLRDRTLTLAFLGTLSALFVWYGLVGLSQIGLVRMPEDPEFSVVMGRGQRVFLTPTPARLLSGEFQQRVETVASDHFPLRAKWAPLYFRAAQEFHRGVLALLPASWAPIRPIWGTTVCLRDGERLCVVPDFRSPQRTASLAKRAEFYNGLARRSPGARVVVVPVVLAGNWLALPPLGFGPIGHLLTGDSQVSQFGAMLAPGVAYAWAGQGLAPAEVLELYFRTDHHFRTPGAYRVYQQIHALLQRGWEGIGPPWLPQRWFSLPGVRFCGSAARKGGAYDGIADPMEDAEFALPSFERKVPGHPVAPLLDRTPYQGRPEGFSRFTNHYGDYFGHSQGLIEYTCPTAPDRRLLVVSDSFDNSMEPLLAGHYRHAWFVDLRHYRAQMGATPDIEQFIREWHADDVLFIGDEGWVLGLRALAEQ